MLGVWLASAMKINLDVIGIKGAVMHGCMGFGTQLLSNFKDSQLMDLCTIFRQLTIRKLQKLLFYILLDSSLS